eukprot:Nk52_evm53s2152 gene=Nk52_evmTU53s2152
MPISMEKNNANLTRMEAKPTSKLSASPAASSLSGSPKAKREATPLLSIFLHATVVLGVFIAYAVTDYFREYIDSWEFVPRESFLHHPMYPAVAVTLYVITINVIPVLMKNRAPFELKYTIALHNWILSAGSFIMLAKIMQDISRVFYQEDGLEKVCCNSTGALSGTQLNFWFHIFYLSKFYELLDTVFLTLRKKPVIFLHWYHHVITLWLVWVCMDTNLSLTWFPSSANALVHVFMYFYYMCQTLHVNVWWKRYLTQLQILQFIIDISGNMSWAYYVSKGKNCSGNWFGFNFAMFVIGSFLVLFIKFYISTYKRGQQQKKSLKKEQ